VAKPRFLRSVLLALIGAAIDAALLAWGLGGFPALLRHGRALALLAVWTIGGLILARLRPARGQEVAERQPEPGLWMPALFLLPLVTPALAAWGERLGIAILPGGAALRWAGVALSAGGLAVRIAAMSQLGPRFSPLLAIQHGHTLETRGLYRRIRHPGYLGAALASTGAALAFGSALGLVPVAVFWALLALRAGLEERMLEARFGDEFRAWRSRTGAFWPR
jgi:protein-S-isoprenylcysteine O-methyltransferase Ste14